MSDKLLARNCVLLDGACKCRKGHLYEDCKYAVQDNKNKEPEKKDERN